MLVSFFYMFLDHNIRGARGLGMEVPSFIPSTQEAQVDLCEIETSLSYKERRCLKK